MNLLLFEQQELALPLSPADRRFQHLTKVLKVKIGDTFDMGTVNGAQGKGTVQAIESHQLTYTFEATKNSVALSPITILLPFIRPVNGQRVLRELSTLGIGKIVQFSAEKSEKSYANSRYYLPGKVRDLLKEGAEQAFCTAIPDYSTRTDLAAILSELGPFPQAVAFDNYEATAAFSDFALSATQPFTLAIGPERGWSTKERALFREYDFSLCHLGSRVLRAETATLAASILSLQKMGLL